MGITIAITQLLVGFVLMMWSADRLVAGAAALARNHGVPPLLVGLTIIGFGTSAPEMLVSMLASLRGNPSLAIGNAIGSNIANVALILGLTALIYPLKVEPQALKREFPVLGGIMILTAALMSNSALGRLDGVLLLGGLVVLVAAMIRWGMAAASSAQSDPSIEAMVSEIPVSMPSRHAAGWTVIGLLVLPVSAYVLVKGAVTLAQLLGVSEAVIGLTIVALGTSLPELAAALASALRKEDDLCIGNILGSNMFNLLGVLGIAAVVHPMAIESILLLRDVPVMFVTFIILAVLAYLKADINRTDAAILFSIYLGYQTAVIWHALAGGRVGVG